MVGKKKLLLLMLLLMLFVILSPRSMRLSPGPRSGGMMGYGAMGSGKRGLNGPKMGEKMFWKVGLYWE